MFCAQSCTTAARVVDMAERCTAMLKQLYSADPVRIVVIAHGAPDIPYHPAEER
jgi:hypothetical protein